MDRRQSLGLMGTMVAALAWAKPSQATTARAVSLRELVQRSTCVARSTPLESFCRSEEVGGAAHIVTYTRIAVEDVIDGTASESELLVRTLGGRIGDLGEIVHGEAELTLRVPNLLFLRRSSEGIEQVTAMAQGRYSLSESSGSMRLFASRNIPHLVGGTPADSAIAQLSGARFSDARALILGARR